MSLATEMRHYRIMATNTLQRHIKKQQSKAAFREKANNQKALKKKLYEEKEWYTIRAILGNQWANW